MLNWIRYLNFWDEAWWFFIINSFWIIVFIFIVISITFRPIHPLTFFRCLSNSGTFTKLQTTPFIKPMGVACSDSVSHKYSCIVTRLHSGLNLQPPDDCLLRSVVKRYVSCWTVQREFLELIHLMILLEKDYYYYIMYDFFYLCSYPDFFFLQNQNRWPPWI